MCYIVVSKGSNTTTKTKENEMEYKGYIIRQAFKKPIEQFNPISGHRWTIPGDMKKGKFNIIGPGMEILREFSLKGAREHIDFLVKFNLNRPFHEMYGDRKQPIPERRQ